MGRGRCLEACGFDCDNSIYSNILRGWRGSGWGRGRWSFLRWSGEGRPMDANLAPLVNCRQRGHGRRIETFTR